MKKKESNGHPQHHDAKHYEGIETPFIHHHGDDKMNGHPDDHEKHQDFVRETFHGK